MLIFRFILLKMCSYEEPCSFFKSCCNQLYQIGWKETSIPKVGASNLTSTSLSEFQFYFDSHPLRMALETSFRCHNNWDSPKDPVLNRYPPIVTCNFIIYLLFLDTLYVSYVRFITVYTVHHLLARVWRIPIHFPVPRGWYSIVYLKCTLKERVCIFFVNKPTISR